MALHVGVKHASKYAESHKLPLLGINHLAVYVDTLFNLSHASLGSLLSRQTV